MTVLSEIYFVTAAALRNSVTIAGVFAQAEASTTRTIVLKLLQPSAQPRRYTLDCQGRQAGRELDREQKLQ